MRRELTDPKELIEDVVASLHTQIDNRPVEIQLEGVAASALARSPAAEAGAQAGARQRPEIFPAALSRHRACVQWPVSNGDDGVSFEITDHGPEYRNRNRAVCLNAFIAARRSRIKSPALASVSPSPTTSCWRITDELTVNSRPGETTFRVTLAPGTDSRPERTVEHADERRTHPGGGRRTPDPPHHAHYSHGRRLRSGRRKNRRRGAGKTARLSSRSGPARHEHARHGRTGRLPRDPRGHRRGNHHAHCAQYRGRQSGGPGCGRRRFRQQALQHAGAAGSHPRGAAAGSSLRAIFRRPHSRR